MLILYRKIGESIVIGQNLNDGQSNPEITVKILSNDSHNVRIGIEAPRDIIVHREEVLKRIKEKNIRTLATSVGESVHAEAV